MFKTAYPIYFSFSHSQQQQKGTDGNESLNKTI